MDRWTNVKVTPGNQTLILAGERGPPAGMPAGLSQLVSSAGSDSVLQRLTIVAAHSDSTMVYLRADYAADGRSPRASATPAASAGYRDVPGNDIVPAAQTQRSLMRVDAAAQQRPDPYGSNRGISLYASTQRMSLEDVHTARVDVHA
jgi:hypothetical protein